MEISFDNAVGYLVQAVIDTEDKPFIVSIHGHPNNGKTHLAKICRDVLYEQHGQIGIFVKTSDEISERFFRYVKDFILIEDTLGTTAVKKYCRNMFGKEPDITTLIAKFPEYYKDNHNDYDLVIDNPDAKKK